MFFPDGGQAHTGQVERAIWGRVDIVQASVMDPTGRPPTGFCDGSRVVAKFISSLTVCCMCGYCWVFYAPLIGV
jgi:hypothetical protein